MNVTGLRLLHLGHVDPFYLHAAYSGLAESLHEDDPGWLLLARSARGHVALGASQYADAELDIEACRRLQTPIVQRPLGGGSVWVDKHQLCVFFIVPRRERQQDFFSRCLRVLRAMYSELGVAAKVVRDQDIWAGGSKLLGSGGASIGKAQVFGASIIELFAAEQFAACVTAPSQGYRAWLETLLLDHMTDLGRLGVEAEEEKIVDALKKACESEWQLCAAKGIEAPEQAAIDAALKELKEPLETGGIRRIRHGIKINAQTYLFEDAASPWIRVVWRAGALVRSDSQDTKIHEVLHGILEQPLLPGMVMRQALQLGIAEKEARSLDQRIVTLVQDAGK